MATRRKIAEGIFRPTTISGKMLVAVIQPVACLCEDLAASYHVKALPLPLSNHSKGGKRLHKRLPLASSAAQALLAWHARRGEVEQDAPVRISLAKNTRGHHLTTRALADIWQRHLSTLRVHATRHTYAHGLEAVGMPVSRIQGLLGHNNIATTGK